MSDRVSEHFRRSEFACHCGCGFAAVDVELLSVLEDLRDSFRSPVHINSACRCAERNAEIGSKPTSMHQRGMAADIRVKGVSPQMVHSFLDGKYPGQYGLGRYKNFTHIDVRTGFARW